MSNNITIQENTPDTRSEPDYPQSTKNTPEPIASDTASALIADGPDQLESTGQALDTGTKLLSPTRKTHDASVTPAVPPPTPPNSKHANTYE
jgi:hypothetical protein